MYLTTKTYYFTKRRVTKVQFPNCSLSSSWAEEQANFLASPAPDPDFFPTGSGSGSWFFSSGSGSGSEEPKTTPASQPCIRFWYNLVFLPEGYFGIRFRYNLVFLPEEGYFGIRFWYFYQKIILVVGSGRIWYFYQKKVNDLETKRWHYS